MHGFNGICERMDDGVAVTTFDSIGTSSASVIPLVLRYSLERTYKDDVLTFALMARSSF